MQTFLPYKDFKQSLECLDNARLGKQRVESMQLLDAMLGRGTSWRRHPACQMWIPYRHALCEYLNISLDVWSKRGFRNTMPYHDVPDSFDEPCWLGWEKFHSSHRANLLRKDSAFYLKQNSWKENPNDSYVWPTNFPHLFPIFSSTGKL